MIILSSWRKYSQSRACAVAWSDSMGSPIRRLMVPWCPALDMPKLRQERISLRAFVGWPATAFDVCGRSRDCTDAHETRYNGSRLRLPHTFNDYQASAQ